jgi:hypothetical protein
MSEIAEAVDRARLLLEEHRFDEALAVLLHADQSHPGDEGLAGEIASVYLAGGPALADVRTCRLHRRTDRLRAHPSRSSDGNRSCPGRDSHQLSAIGIPA